MAKQLLFNDDARKKMLSGVEQISRAVKVTLGPKGRLVMLDKKFGAPTITKDGVSVAKEIELEDPYENMGAQLVKEVASKTNDVAGDGTTTATVLAYSMVREGLKAVAAGITPIEIKRGMDKAVALSVEEIKKIDTTEKKGLFILAPTPMRVFGKGTLPNDIMEMLNIKNIAAGMEGMSPTLTPEYIIKENPDIILTFVKNPQEIVKANPQIKDISAIKNNKFVVLETGQILRGSPRMIDYIADVYQKTK